MLDWTDRHERYFLRLISKHALLYTEMVTTGAIIHGDAHRYLRFNEAEHPVALQLGGSDPADLAHCSKIAASYDYDEVNLNLGCPSNRVQNGSFGACMMAQPQLVADCLKAMLDAVDIPVTAKIRIGIDGRESFQELVDYVAILSKAGCQIFIVHARIAILQGLSPKQNREVPPLKYDVVYRLKQQFPDLTFIINGGIKTIQECHQHLKQVDGVMLGREAYHNPYVLAEVDGQFYQDDHIIPTRHRLVEQMLPYVEQQLTEGVPLLPVIRHMLGLFHAQPGGKLWRRYISEHGHKKGAGVEVLQQALQLVQPV